MLENVSICYIKVVDSAVIALPAGTNFRAPALHGTFWQPFHVGTLISSLSLDSYSVSPR